MNPTDAEIGAAVRSCRMVDELTDEELAKAIHAVRPDLYEEAVHEATIELLSRQNPHM